MVQMQQAYWAIHMYSYIQSGFYANTYVKRKHVFQMTYLKSYMVVGRKGLLMPSYANYGRE